MRRSPLFYVVLLALSAAILVVGATAQDSADPTPTLSLTLTPPP